MKMGILGFSGSGKTTLAVALHDLLKPKCPQTVLLDGDVIRTNLSKGLGFSKEDRETNVRRVGFVCELLSRNGVIPSCKRTSRGTNCSNVGSSIGDLLGTALTMNGS